MQTTTITNYVTLDHLVRAVRRAADEGLRLRMHQGVDNRGRSYIKYAVGGGMWTPPLYCEEAHTMQEISEQATEPVLPVGTAFALAERDWPEK